MKKSFLQTTFYTILVTIMMVPFFVFGEEHEFIPIVGIPGVNANAQGIEPYINALFILAIAVAAISAVIRIILSGVSYMFSEVVTDKGQAKKDIIGAILGLLLILGGVTILNEINPNLTSFSALRDAQPVTVRGGATHDQIREQLINENPNVISTYTGGDYGGTEHITFVQNCMNNGGVVVEQSTNNLECRTGGTGSSQNNNDSVLWVRMVSTVNDARDEVDNCPGRATQEPLGTGNIRVTCNAQ